MKTLATLFTFGLVPVALLAAAAPNGTQSAPAPMVAPQAPSKVASPSLQIPAEAAGQVPAATAQTLAPAPTAKPAPAQVLAGPESTQAASPAHVPKLDAGSSAQKRRAPRASAVEARAPVLVPEQSTTDRPLAAATSEFSPQEQAALAIARRWRDSSSNNSLTPVAGRDGTVRFLYGATQPRIVCAVLQVCDIELQRGEQVNSLNIGDQRWVIEPAVSGAGATEVVHLVIKPQDVDLETTLMVATNRRTYHMLLRSHRSEYIPRVAFIYPEEAAAKWDAIAKREAVEKADSTIPSTGEVLGELSFDYRVEGSAPWKPVRVYNNGQKTVIQMPASIAQTEAPTLLLVRKDGGVFTDEETAMVNYRVQNDRYIVDSLFDRAILIAGVGSSQDRITITRGK